jgi:cytoskeletal protein CcmA (bactofilin family)
VARKDKPGKSGSLDTLIGSDTVLEGNVESGGSVRVDGKLKGDLKSGGDVFVGRGAKLTGNIYANNVVLSGQVVGNVYAEGMLRLLSEAKLHGNVQAHGLVADEGGVLHGKCNIVEERSTSQRERASGANGEQAAKELASRAPRTTRESKESAGGQAS